MQLIKLPEDKEIRQHNTITSSRFDYSACQLDILFMIIAQLGKDDDPNKVYSIHVTDIEAITGRKWNYQQLRDATQEMGSRMFEQETKEIYTQFWLFQWMRYHLGKGYFEVRLSEIARPLLFDLKDNYTAMQLKAVLSCSSKYAKRLYALCCQWRSKGKVSFSIDDIKTMLSLKDPTGKQPEQFIRISDFERFVLKVAKEQINELTDIRFDYKLDKLRRRSVQAVHLFINQNPNPQTQIDFKEPVKPDKVSASRKMQILTEWGFKGKNLEKLAKLPAELIQQIADEVDNKIKAGEKIANPQGYFMKILQNKKLI